MGRKSNAQKLEETTKRLEGVIKYNKENIERDIKEYSYRIGNLLYQESVLIKEIKNNLSILDISNRRAEALKSVLPTEESFGKFMDEYFIDWKRQEVEDVRGILNIDIVVSFIASFLEKKFGYVDALKKITKIKEILEI